MASRVTISTQCGQSLVSRISWIMLTMITVKHKKYDIIKYILNHLKLLAKQAGMAFKQAGV